MKRLLLLITSLLSSIFGNAQCDHTFRMYDSWGDGWNGATVDINVNGVTVIQSAEPTIGAGGGIITSDDILFSASTGDNITLTNWISGSWNNEISWEILDINDSVIASGYYGSVPPVIGNCILPSGPQTYVPDDFFEQALELSGMGNGILNDDSVLTANISSVTSLTLGGSSISDFTGIEDFISLDTLNLNYLSIGNLSFSNANLRHLYCNSGQLPPGSGLQNLDISNLPALETLDCGYNDLVSLDLSNNPVLSSLDCSHNILTSLDLNNNPVLSSLDCSYNLFTSIDLSNNNIRFFTCTNTNLSSLDLSNTTIQQLSISECPLFSLDVSGCDSLTNMDVTYTQLESLDISDVPNLTELLCNNNLLSCLNTKNGNWSNMTVNAYSNNLTCAEVDNIGYATNNWLFDSFTTFSLDCNYTNCSWAYITENISDISLFPNPTQDQITIDINGYNGPVNVEVYDLQGRLLETTRTTTVPLRKYERGIYIFKVNYGEIIEEVRVVRE